MAFNATFTAIVINYLQKALIQETPLLKVFTLDASIGASTTGALVKARLRAAPGSATRYDASSNNYESSTSPDLDEVTGTMNAPLKITKKVQPIHLINGLALQGMIEDMGRQMMSDVFTDACSVVTNANYGTAVLTGAATTLTNDKMIEFAAITAQGLGWMQGSRMAVLQSTYYANLAKDDDIKSWGTPAAEAMINTAIIRPTVSGWTTWNAPQLPGNSENLTGFITDGSGIVLASGLDAAAPGLESQLWLNETITIPGCPIMQVVGHASPKDNSSYITIKCLTTPFKGRTNGLKRITSA